MNKLQAFKNWICDFTNFLATLCQATVGHHQWKKGPKEYRHRLFLFLFVPNHLLGIKNVGSTVQPIFQVFASNHWGRILFWVRHTVLYTKWYKNSNEYCTFLFSGRLGHLGSTENSAILLHTVSYFWGWFFSCFHGQINEKNWISINYNCEFLL